MTFFRFFRNLQIRNKLLLGYSLIFILMVILGNVSVYYYLRKIISNDLHSSVERTTQTSVALIEESINLSIRNHLYAHSLESEGLVKNYYQRVQAGDYTKQEAQKIILEDFLSDRIGLEGYIFVMDPKGVVLSHPNPVLLGKSIAFNKDIAKILENPDGYFEYNWKNPYDKIQPRSKALYAFYFKPWDWIICVSVYASDFKLLINVDDFTKYLKSMQFERGGYAFVIDGSGDFVYHPYMTHKGLTEKLSGEGINMYKEISRLKNGKLEYTWQNPGEEKFYRKLAVFNHIPELDWIVGTAVYADEYFTPLFQIRIIFWITSVLILALLIPISLKISSLITKPIQKIISEFSRGAAGDLSVRVPVESNDEIGVLSGYFNNFMADLEQYHKNLEEEISARESAQHERALLEEQLLHSQKMEAIGQLTGGVAHDFNNILTAIMGNAELLTLDFKGTKENLENVEQILKASQRARDLTKRLLGFSRKKQLEVTEVSIKKVINDTIELLKPSLAKNIAINKNITDEIPEIIGDPTQIQNCLLNLALNARDAMPDGGKLTFSTKNTVIDEEYCRKHPFTVTPGPYIQVKVCDTGSGMDKETQSKIFEPFFTTKEKGTGLGLASVYGCVKAHQGTLNIYSEKGHGTTFDLYFPSELESSELPSPLLDEQIVRGTGHILLIDDEESIRKYAVKALQGFGYTTTTCQNGLEALKYFEEHHNEVKLVILDMIMPGLSGKHVYEGLKKINPSVPVLLCSGFSDEQSVPELIEKGAAGFIIKPFQISQFSQTVAKCIKNENDSAAT